MAPFKEPFLMRRIVIILTLLLLAIPSVAANIGGKVVKVADGDTITILDSANQQHRIRLAGIDAPEKRQPYGNASKKRVTELIAGKEVRVEYEKYDRYGRIVGKVWVSPPDCPTCGKTLYGSLAQITSGMASCYWQYAREQPPEDRSRYEFAERDARAKRVGLWQEPTVAMGIQACLTALITCHQSPRAVHFIHHP